MQEYLTQANQFGNEYAGIIGLIGVVSIVAAVVGFFKKNEIKLYKVIKSDYLIRDHENRYEKLKIQFDDKDIKNLTASKILIFNSGKISLRSSDISESDFLGIALVEGYEILDVKIVDEISDGCGFSINLISNNICKLVFNYINPKNAVLVHMLHTGTSYADLRVLGKGAGLKEVKENFVDKEIYPPTIAFTIMAAVVWVFILSAGFLEKIDLGTIIITMIAILCTFISFILLHNCFSTYWLRKLIKKM